MVLVKTKLVYNSVKFQIFPRSIHGENLKNPLSELCEKENRAKFSYITLKFVAKTIGQSYNFH